ncbi:MAG: bifunctional pyr operon transcriptional regulator/uracil phosphoribosyltransferase PyrR [Candidatus Omnitrophica bacterium]|nr:bifunctional pyr operon transcriptional regulator/uracil phosphoribosyltransferase PyrR [Candidatus Omnitrophota bacterium]
MKGLKKVVDEEQIRRAIMRISHEIVERNKGVDNVVLIGIRTGGAFLSARIQNNIKLIEEQDVPMGILDITLYRDDLREVGPQPEFRGTEIDFDITGKIVVLIDDVLFSGRTIRCALDHLIDLGRPKAIQLAVLIDRGHRELPIRADYVGKNIPSHMNEEIIVRLLEDTGKDEVLIIRKNGEDDEGEEE